MKIIIVYVTHESESDAKILANKLISERLIACSNIFPIQSSFWWKEHIQLESEWVSILKTIPENWQALQDRVIDLHPYDIPCIMKFEVEVNSSYGKWIFDNVIPKY